MIIEIAYALFPSVVMVLLPTVVGVGVANWLGLRGMAWNVVGGALFICLLGFGIGRTILILSRARERGL